MIESGNHHDSCRRRALPTSPTIPNIRALRLFTNRMEAQASEILLDGTIGCPGRDRMFQE